MKGHSFNQAVGHQNIQKFASYLKEGIMHFRYEGRLPNAVQ